MILITLLTISGGCNNTDKDIFNEETEQFTNEILELENRSLKKIRR